VIEDLLRPPRTAAELIADLIRVAGALSVVVAVLWWTPTDAGILAFTLPALLLPRILVLRAGLDLAYGVTLLAAAWSNVLDLHRTLPWWDVPAHLVCTALIALVVTAALERGDVVPFSPDRARRRIIVVPTIGLAAGALWEMVEWFGKTFISDAIHVTYDDTIGDLAVGGLGALAAGTLFARARLVRVAS